jgi:sulfide:quinone oxidoreductase
VNVATRVVIAGGGVAALEAALALQGLADELVDVELVAPETHFFYRPLSVAEPFGLGETRQFDLASLASAAGAVFSPGTVARVDARSHVVHTSHGPSIEYDALLVASGAMPTVAVPGALTFRGPADTDRIRGLLEELGTGDVDRLAFVISWGAAWSLPIYELALMTAANLAGRGIDGVELALVTPEEEPLQLFGPAASEAVRALLEERQIRVHTSAYTVELVDGELRGMHMDPIPADRAVALPRLRGARIDGLPQTADGFVPVDPHGRVQGLADVFAAGDITTFPIKQGGIATQQADAAAEAIAAGAGAEITPEPFRPVLRGLLLTGSQPRYLRHTVAGADSAASAEPLWWPPAKIVGRYLAPFLAEVAGIESPPEAPTPEGAVAVERELEREHARPRTTLWLEARDAPEDAPTVADVMAADPVLVEPDATLAEAAEKMRDHDSPALVDDFGRLIGIVTSADLLRAFAARVHPSEARVREWMTAEPVAVSTSTPVETAMTLMSAYGFQHLPVVEDERPVGIVALHEAVRNAQLRPGVGLGF